VEVRLARSEDAEGIRDIYNLEVTTSTVTFDLVPRTPSEQRAWLEARSGAHAVVVATGGDGGDGGEVLGFGSLSPYRDRPAYRTTVEDSVYVRRDHRGAGVGQAVLGELLVVAAAHGFHSVMARIVGGHQASIALHAGHGFTMVGVEREVGRKFNRWLDVAVMQRLL
jgi:phosphinothricin acetyltransferase